MSWLVQGVHCLHLETAGIGSSKKPPRPLKKGIKRLDDDDDDDDPIRKFHNHNLILKVLQYYYWSIARFHLRQSKLTTDHVLQK